MGQTPSRKDRRYTRVETPRGLWVAWGEDNHKMVSRVSDLNVGGLFISTPAPLPVGALIKLLLAVQEGEIKAHAVVRNSSPNVGMGVEFTAMGAVDRERLNKLVERLLALQNFESF
jgi:hypothetical protein